MITILNRLFPSDISLYIINIIKNENIKRLCNNKYFVMQLMMENIIKKYRYDRFYNIIYDITNIKQIYELHTFVLKNDKNMSIDFQDTINNYYKVLNYHNNYQNNNIKHIIKNYL